MKQKDHPGGILAFRGAISWRTVCFLSMALVSLGLGGYAFVFLTSSGCGHPKISQMESDFKSFDSALSAYKLLGGNFPSTAQGLEALVKMPTGDPVPVRWVRKMSKIPLDPWGKPYFYKFPSRKGPTDWEILCLGPDGAKGTADDLSTQDE